MINWMYFPKNKKIDEVSIQVLNAFKSISTVIDSEIQAEKSDWVLDKVRPFLEDCGFDVEKGKKKEDKLSMPVLFGKNGRIEKQFDVDAFLEIDNYVVEVEAGRAVTNFQFLKDFFEACAIYNADKLCIAVRNTYITGSLVSKDFERVCTFFESMYASGRLGIPLEGILIIGY